MSKPLKQNITESIAWARSKYNEAFHSKDLAAMKEWRESIKLMQESAKLNRL